MRTAAFVLVFALVVIACGQAPKPQAPEQREAAIALDARLKSRLAVGIPIAVELRSGDAPVGACTIQYDLWDERYKAVRSKTEYTLAADVEVALRHCIERPVTAPIQVVERAAPTMAAPAI